MKLGVHRDTLAPSLAGADAVFVYAPPDLGWDATSITQPLGARARLVDSLDTLLRELDATARSGDHVLIMSNGGFGGLHRRLLDALRARG